MNGNKPLAPPPESLWAALEPIVKEKVLVEDRAFWMCRPANADRLLDHPAVQEAFAQDEYMPYWADLWPAARMLAKALIRHYPAAPKGGQALEIGCGLGLPGIVALSLGLRVTFSDYDPCALRFAADNARLNGFTDFELLHMDWRHFPEDLRSPFILASDLVYELRQVEPLVAFIRKVLLPGGSAWLTDQDRIPAQALRDTLTAQGLQFTTKIMHAGQPGGRRVRGTWYCISHGERSAFADDK